MAPPLVVDIDGTLSRADRSIDARVFDPLREWPAPVVVATGKAMPYPVALCTYVGIDRAVVAENGGVVVVGDDVRLVGDREAADAVARDLRERGHDLGWGPTDLVNRWRETEIAVSRELPLDVVEAVAADHGLEVVDSQFAYHVKSPAVDKGAGLVAAAEVLGLSPGDFVAVGDSANDVETFERAGRSYAVANAADAARAAADVVTDGAYAEGFLEAIADVREGSP